MHAHNCVRLGVVQSVGRPDVDVETRLITFMSRYLWQLSSCGKTNEPQDAIIIPYIPHLHTVKKRLCYIIYIYIHIQDHSPSMFTPFFLQQCIVN